MLPAIIPVSAPKWKPPTAPHTRPRRGLTWISVAPGAGHALGYSLNDLHGVTAGIVSLVVWVLIFIPYTFVAGALMRTESDAGVED